MERMKEQDEKRGTWKSHGFFAERFGGFRYNQSAIGSGSARQTNVIAAMVEPEIEDASSTNSTE